MKILAIQNYNTTKKANNHSLSVSKDNYLNHADSFKSSTSNSKPNFGMLTSSQLGLDKTWHWTKNSLKIVERDKSEMTDLAEYFHDLDVDGLKKIFTDAYGEIKGEDIAIWSKFRNAVKVLQANKPDMNQAELRRLDEKAAKREDLFRSKY